MPAKARAKAIAADFLMAKPPYRVLIVFILGNQNEFLMKIYLRLETSKRRYNLKYYDMPNPFGALPPL
jgi:hypothetical protein